LSLTVIGVFALAALVYCLPVRVSQALTLLAAQSQGQKPEQKKEQNDRQALAKNPPPTGTLKDRLGEDDDYGLTLFYSADIGGNLEVCGCPIRPLGGVARRLGYINAFRQRSPEAAVLMVDAGHIFSDDVNEEETALRADAQLMNDWIVRANEQMPLEVVNLSFRDLRYASQLLQKDAKLKTEKSTLISANIKAVDAGRVNPAPYVIKTVTGKRLPKPVRIAFIGLSDAPPENLKAAVAHSGFVVEDVLAAAKKTLAEVKDKADLTVIVGYLKLGTANKLALQNEDLDLIIAADGRGLVPDPKQVNNALILYAANQTKHLGELRCYVDAQGVVDRFTARYVELDEVIPDDAEMARVTRQARGEIDVVQRQMAEVEATAHATRSAASKQPLVYVTSQVCAACHKQEYEVWQKTRHAHAFAALESKQRAFDASCVGCHSLGFQKQGFVNIKATPQFAGVHCESCHGPGAAHVAAPKAGNYKTPEAPASCITCHDRENSPDFVFPKYWAVVAHSNSAKPAAAPKAKGKVVRKR
jgi:2',3'-cyclic-nucleotide 2'-phosphodiesterase (5'-nucleotidase family)